MSEGMSMKWLKGAMILSFSGVWCDITCTIAMHKSLIKHDQARLCIFIITGMIPCLMYLQG